MYRKEIILWTHFMAFYRYLEKDYWSLHDSHGCV